MFSESVYLFEQVILLNSFYLFSVKTVHNTKLNYFVKVTDNKIEFRTAISLKLNQSSSFPQLIKLLILQQSKRSFLNFLQVSQSFEFLLKKFPQKMQKLFFILFELEFELVEDLQGSLKIGPELSLFFVLEF